MSKQKISVNDFKQDALLQAHTRKSKEVARALDVNADALPYSRVLTSYEFEDFLQRFRIHQKSPSFLVLE